MRKIIVFFLLLAVFGILSARSKLNESTIKAELRKPGVKLVAIDFYMTGCPPCDAAIPIWKKLKKEYGDALKLFVVAPQRDDGTCNVKGWNNVKMICDEDMEIAGEWGVKDFPQAFLYSWHNNDPLVKLGHVNDVEKAIKEYFKHIPRVVLDADSNSRNLVPKVEEALKMNSKIELVSSAAEQKQLLALKKQSHQRNYDENLKCELGKQISANSVLKITKEDGDLVLRLSSVEESCTRATATKSLSGDKQKLKTEVAAAVYELLSQIFDNISTPDESAKPVKTQMPVAQGSNSPDSKACEYAKNKGTIEMWEKYLKKFPNGECSFEAESKIEEIKKKNREERLKKAITALNSQTNSNEKYRLAVMEFEDKSGKFQKTTLSDYGEYFRGSLAKSNIFFVITKERQELAKMKYCNNKNCQIQLGQALSADFIIQTAVTYFGGIYTVSSELIDLGTEATVIVANATFDGTEESFLEALVSMAARIAVKTTEVVRKTDESQSYKDDRLKVAIMEIEDKSSKFQKKTLSNSEEYFRGALASSNKFFVISKERQESVKNKKSQNWNQIQLGKALSADLIIRTKITILGKKYTMNSELIDLEKEATVIVANATFDGTEESFREALDNIATKIAILTTEAKQNDDRLKVAIMEIEDENDKFQKTTLSNAEEYFRGALASSNEFLLIPKERQESVKNKKSQNWNQIQLGKALSADLIIRTKITILGKKHIINSELIDLEKEATIIGASTTFDGSEESFIEALDNIATRIAILTTKVKQNDDRLKVAIMEIEDENDKFQKTTLSNAEEYFRGALASSNEFLLIPKERQESVKNKKSQNWNQMIQLGQALATDLIIRTKIIISGKKHIINSELIDLEKEAKEATVIVANATFDGSEESLAKALDNIVEQITR